MDTSIDLFTNGVFIGNTNFDCSVAKVRKNNLNICSREFEFNHFADEDRVPNCVKGLRNIKRAPTCSELSNVS